MASRNDRDRADWRHTSREDERGIQPGDWRGGGELGFGQLDQGNVGRSTEQGDPGLYEMRGGIGSRHHDVHDDDVRHERGEHRHRGWVDRILGRGTHEHDDEDRHDDSSRTVQRYEDDTRDRDLRGSRDSDDAVGWARQGGNVGRIYSRDEDERLTRSMRDRVTSSDLPRMREHRGFADDSHDIRGGRRRMSSDIDRGDDMRGGSFRGGDVRDLNSGRSGMRGGDISGRDTHGRNYGERYLRGGNLERSDMRRRDDDRGRGNVRSDMRWRDDDRGRNVERRNMRSDMRWRDDDRGRNVERSDMRWRADNRADVERSDMRWRDDHRADVERSDMHWRDDSRRAGSSGDVRYRDDQSLRAVTRDYTSRGGFGGRGQFSRLRDDRGRFIDEQQDQRRNYATGDRDLESRSRWRGYQNEDIDSSHYTDEDDTDRELRGIRGASDSRRRQFAGQSDDDNMRGQFRRSRNDGELGRRGSAQPRDAEGRLIDIEDNDDAQRRQFMRGGRDLRDSSLREGPSSYDQDRSRVGSNEPWRNPSGNGHSRH